MRVSPAFTAIGANRNPAAADWDAAHGLLAFGAGDAVALWDPQDDELKGVQAVLNGHAGVVNAVKFFQIASSGNVSIIISGAADHTLRVWRSGQTPESRYEAVKIVTGHHSGPITRIATLDGEDLFATGASDGTVKIWKLVHDADFSTIDVELIQSITLTPRHFPLAISLAKLDDETNVMAVAGTRATIQIFVSKQSQFELAATLTGHEGWIRALDFTRETESEDSDLLLASASQDKYIRLWRLHRGEELPAVSTALNDPALGVLGKSLSNKAHRFASATSKYSVTFEALLLGHEDWIYTASWRRREGKLQLLSTSEDNSLSIWEADSSSGIWVCSTRLGEISAQKGSTSATGSAGGFWIGLWSPDGNSVVSLGRTGSWRKWTYSAAEDTWAQQVAITGHVREVKGVCWSKDGEYLLTTSSDQTTRLFAEWKKESGSSSWHEFSRPQIHGYDLSCIDSITPTQFISGADEKLLRVFDEPKGVAEILQKLCEIDTRETSSALPDAANIPVLGLSNKAIQAVSDEAFASSTAEEANPNGDTTQNPASSTDPIDPSSIVRKSTLDLNHPPFEDHLARHLLWPETEKLYGHGYEISAVAVSHSGTLVATACRASSLDHAVIRVYSTNEWEEVGAPLKAHTLTVTALTFSSDDTYLLSVGRDRQWVLWERDSGCASSSQAEPAEDTADKPKQSETSYKLKIANPKGHSRMVLDAAWAPSASSSSLPTFFTAGRDKAVKIWQVAPSGTVDLKASVAADTAVTAVACPTSTISSGNFAFAFGTESGEFSLVSSSTSMEELKSENLEVSKVPSEIRPAKAITAIKWRPGRDGAAGEQIAVASEDATVRVYKVVL
ncbi:WD40 repeat-like protein [Periconia macrospinosa]|uniref:Elongator complex protein 2 n=1 Tax=Periconia macrospinosa TaxID=97972 RepID=A0A2V1DRJ0_9PLEO|nr:WD40 repeat-like protein [Periconia macrospinosa]